MSPQEWLLIRDDDALVNKIIICEVSGKPFRIIKQELEFYRSQNLPLPTRHREVRYDDRMSQRPGRIMHLRDCDKC